MGIPNGNLAKLTIKDCKENVGQFSLASKMPGLSWGIPIEYCNTGSKLIDVEGSTCHGCYADSGAYIWENTQNAYERRYQAYIKDPLLWVQSMIYFFHESTVMIREPFFRFFDSGDIQSLEMLMDIATVAYACPHINFWVPTKEYQIYHDYLKVAEPPNNMIIRVSAPMKDTILKTDKYEWSSTTYTKEKFDEMKDVEDWFFCPASSQKNSCGDCRACWDPDVPVVVYKYHGAKKYNISRKLLQIERAA